MNRLSLKHPEAWADELLDAEILGNLEGITGLVKHLDTVQGEYPDLIPHMTAANQIKGPVEEPDFVRIQLAP